MPRSTVLLIPGLRGSEPDHWQTRWEEERTDCRRIDQGEGDPDPLRWLARIDTAVDQVSGPVVLVAHSLGCLAVAAWALLSQRATSGRVQALLVAPCDPGQIDAPLVIRRFGCFAFTKLPIPTTVIASSDDPYASLGRGYAIARTWGANVVEAGEAGHIDANSRLGSWRWGQDVLDRLIVRA
ncbi:MAG: alpha/beta hydrolase [Sphingomonadales bacterium]|nr:alpha/beta hydrolase [Sphingomonadales bacterium]